MRCPRSEVVTWLGEVPTHWAASEEKGSWLTSDSSAHIVRSRAMNVMMRSCSKGVRNQLFCSTRDHSCQAGKSIACRVQHGATIFVMHICGDSITLPSAVLPHDCAAQTAKQTIN